MGRGAEGLHISSIVKAYENKGHQVTVVSPPGIDPMKEYGEKPLDKASEETKGIKTLWKSISKYAPEILFEVLEILYNIYAIIRIKKIVKQKRVDIIYERNAYFLFAGAFIARHYKIPLVVEVNEVVGIRRARPLILRVIATSIEKYVFEKSKVIFAVSSLLKSKINSCTTCPVIVTPNAVDPSRFNNKSNRDEIRRKFCLEDRIVLGFAGWFDWWDRLDLLLLAQKKIIDLGYTNVSTIIIGEGLRLSELKEMSKQLGIDDRVIFTGAVNRKEIIDYLDAIDIGVLPHSNDFGSPVVLFEMMALGKIIVAPSLMPIQDVIVHGTNGFMFPPLDSDMMAKTISDIIINYKAMKNIGDRAREITLKEHTWDNNASVIIDSVLKACSKSSLS